jgi:hypothetical protein
MLSTKNVVILGGAGLVFAYANMKTSEHRKDMIEEFQLTPQQVTVMENCESSFGHHKKKFKQSINKPRGCACIAKKVGARAKPAHYQAASAALHFIMDAKSTSPKHAQRSAARFSVSEAEMRAHLPTGMVALGYCAQAKNYMTAEQRAVIEKAEQRTVRRGL